MIKLLVIADDLTGALDTGVQFAKKGISTYVSLDCNFEDLDQMGQPQVLVINTDSRHVDPEIAYSRVCKVTQRACSYGIPYIYKKIDSTLRGNIGAELKAVLDGASSDALVLVPALPKLNRITVNGIQYVDGSPLAESRFAYDPLDPVTMSAVANIIAQQCDYKVVGYSIQEDLDELSNEFDEKTICLFDASTDEELQQIFLALQSSCRTHLIAGCAGFAEYLSQLNNLSCDREARKIRTTRMLVVSGSVNNSSLQQVDFAGKVGYPVMLLDPTQKFDGSYTESEDFLKFAGQVSSLLDEKQVVIISTLGSENQFVEKGAGEHLDVANNIGKIVKGLLSKISIDLLVVFGGDTLLGIVDALECIGITPEAEIFDGVAMGEVALSDQKAFYLISKAGGFGDETLISDIIDFIRS